jgi:hypothetical protein
MKAIVLSYDKQVGLAQLVIKAYQNMGVANYLEFLVPINQQDTRKYFDQFDNVRCIDSPEDIINTMRSLLEGIPDEEWVYWCIDDRYPLSVNPYEFERILELINKGDLAFANGIKLMHWREDLTNETKIINNIEFSKQESIGTMGFWHHHFLRAKVLRRFFLTDNIHNYNQIGRINRYQNKKEKLDFFDGYYVPMETTIATFGEPLTLGRLTKNGFKALEDNNCIVPDYECIDENMGFLDCDMQYNRTLRTAKILKDDEI